MMRFDTYNNYSPFNDAGMVTEMTYPDESVHRFSYDPNLGRLTKIGEGENKSGISDFVSDFEYNKSGVVTRMNYANSTYQTWEFDNRKRIKHITIGNSDEELVDMEYTINGSGDVTRINNNTYEYDGFDRIVGAKTYIADIDSAKKGVIEHFGTTRDGNNPYQKVYNEKYDIYPEGAPDGLINGGDHYFAILSDIDKYDIESFEYDKNGNRTKLVQNGDVYEYTYGERNRLETIHKIDKESSNKKLFAEYRYDANGNTKKRIIYKDDETVEIINFTYDTMNRLVTTRQGSKTTTYRYDNAGNRFIKDDGETTNIYLRHGQIAVAMDIEIYTSDDDNKGKTNRYILSGDLVAGRVTRTVKLDGEVTSDKYYYHLDHLNSTKAATKEDGTIDVQYEYRAFGEQLKRLGEGEAKYTYGGKELDSQTNLYYFNARYYDATIGRFINVDPIQDGTNWYVYCNNNPLSFVDPTGLSKRGIAIASIGMGIATVGIASLIIVGTGGIGAPIVIGGLWISASSATAAVTTAGSVATVAGFGIAGVGMADAVVSDMQEKEMKMEIDNLNKKVSDGIDNQRRLQRDLDLANGKHPGSHPSVHQGSSDIPLPENIELPITSPENLHGDSGNELSGRETNATTDNSTSNNTKTSSIPLSSIPGAGNRE